MENYRAKARLIELKAKGLSNHLFTGEYQTAFKGRGMSFSEVRAYQYGDEVRTIDWNVTARMNFPHIKTFEEERELNLMLLIDVSGSGYFGTQDHQKTDVMLEAAAVLSVAASLNNDKVGVIFFSDRIERVVPLKKGRQHTLRIIHDLMQIKPVGKGTNLNMALQYMDNMISKRSIVFVLSDFLTRGYENSLRIVSRRHDVVGMHISDPAEHKLPDIGLAEVVDPETGERRLLDTSSPKVQEAFARYYRDQIAYYQDTFRRSGADTIVVDAADENSYVNELLRFFRRRH